MDFLDYIGHASRYKESNRNDFADEIKIRLVTNFTDDILKNVLTGIALANKVYPVIDQAPYRQYHLALKDPKSALWQGDPNITFLFFNMNPFGSSEFRSSKEHFEEVLHGVEQYSRAAKGTVVLNDFIVSYQGAYGNLFRHDPLFALAQEYNEKLAALAERLPNLVIFDTNRLVHIMGESSVFDLRGLYAFDVPFTHEFMTVLAEEWFAFVRALLGKAKKCIVVDLDNTLWGGVVGELGPLGIALGPDYPGNAFVNFQRALLEFYDRGIILAIVSKNNIEDVQEVFQKNPHMVLKEKHFAAVRANWGEKAENLMEIAKELNIGVESMVFLDDDPLNREMVAARLPGITVPDFSMPPEEYAQALYALNLFHQFALTEEDTQKGKMYAEERQRKKIAEVAVDINQYIAKLGIKIKASVNAETIVPRLSQLTLKTNQFNLTTKRYSENDIKKLIADGALIFAANVSDTFGDYGTVVMAIVIPGTHHEATLDTFLMSCRVMGRGVECVFIDRVLRELNARGITKLHASFIPSAKNKPAETFLHGHGFSVTAEPNTYMVPLPAYIKKPCSEINKAITITT